MNRQRFRVFVSSPGDVAAAREVAAQIIEKLAHEYARFFIVEPYLWEYEPMLASGHFQDSIDTPSHFDAVILILESRLGTPLPERTTVREYRGMDGRTPVTGTEWEFEDALSGARAHGVPDLLVYRSRRAAEIDTWDLHSRQAVLKQVEALDAFWSRHFAHEGKFIGAYAKFRTLEELATKLEQDLRSCVQRRLEKFRPEERLTGVRLWPAAPFRGLEAYEFEHSPIFFGREEATGAALLRLITQAETGRPFLLILGSSGSGKSSLVKAGVLPRLSVPQRVSGAAFLRRVAFHPGDAQADEDLFLALARILTLHRGEGIGLPELLGKSMTVEDLARHLRENPSHPDLPLAMVLDRLAEPARQRGRMLQYEQPRLILELDQLEELFTSERVQPEERRRFVQLLAGLARSGFVWVIATMRSDFWHRAAETPELVELADRDGRLDLLPPRPSELSQMLRGPAEAAAIHFEAHATTGIPLNDLVAQEAAAEPGALPLLSYLLDQLYQRDIQDGSGDTLTYASYNALGGLKGAIATRADAVIASQPPEVQQALRSVLFALVQMTPGEGDVDRAVARRAPLSDFPQGTARRRLIEALLDPSTRLLVADAVEDRESTVRLAHEALIHEWRTAKEYVATSAEALRNRRTLEDRFARWQADHGARPNPLTTTSASRLTDKLSRRFARERGLLTDLDLMDAKRLVADYHDELGADLVAYVHRSSRRDNQRHQRAVRLVSAVAVVMALLALGAGYEARTASIQRNAAQLAQLRSLTQTAADRLSEGDAPHALAIILAVMRSAKSERLRYTPEMLNVFQEARAADAQMQLIMDRNNHVYSAAFSPDGTRIASGYADGTARVWDAATGKQLLILRGHSARVQDASFSPDGKLIATASWDNTVRLSNSSSGELLRVLRGHTDYVETIRFSPDGQRLVSSSRDATARIWDVASGRQLMVLRGHKDRVYSAVFSPDGRYIVTASADKTARVWNASSGRQILVLNGHAGAVISAVFSPDGQRIATASADQTARIWNALSGEPLLVLKGHQDGVYGIDFSPDGKTVVTGSLDRTVRLWDASTGRQIKLLAGHTSGVSTAAFSRDGTRLVTASDDNTVRVWDVSVDRETVRLEGHSMELFTADCSRDGRLVVTASADRTARIWDATSGVQIRVLRGHTDAVEDAEFSPDGTRVVTASADGTARIWDTTSGHTLIVLRGFGGAVSSAMFSPDGQLLATASYDNMARIWNASTGNLLTTLKGHTDHVETVYFSPDGREVVTASDDKTARVWATQTGRQLLIIRGHTGRVQVATFSQDGTRILTASSDGSVRIWNATTGEQLLAFLGDGAAVSSAAYSSDGRRVVTASEDGTVRLWDAATGEQLLVLTGHTNRVEDAEFTSDGLHIVSASDDRTARIWDARSAGVGIEVAWATAAQFEPLPSAERYQLGFTVLPSASAYPDDYQTRPTLCDEEAAAPYDPDRPAYAVASEAAAVSEASTSCSARTANGSSEYARLIYQRGRGLFAAGRYPDAQRAFEEAIARGYRSAGVDLAALLSDPTMGMLNLSRAITLYEQAWKAGVPIAAFELGRLYEHGVRTSDRHTYVLSPDSRRAWFWYQRGYDAAEPNSTARFADRALSSTIGGPSGPRRTSHLLRALEDYTAASECARKDGWPEPLWIEWRYRRASLARILAHEQQMAQAAEAYVTGASRCPDRSPHAWDHFTSLISLR
jgi:WD40 repeat protein/TPR repeat protein